jgi:restriction modification system DNA specificity domain protein
MKMQLYKLNQLLLDMHSGGTPDTSKPEYWNGNFKWLSSGETRQRFIENTESQITQLGIEKSSTKLAKKNDVVMACAGQGKTRGQVSFLLDDMYINQSVIAMTTDEKILHPLYLFYNLSGRYNELRGSSDASSTRGSITTKSLKKLAMLIPNIESQKNITDILIAYDNLIENNNKRICLLEQMAENLYKEWFVRFRFPGYEDVEFESGIPKGWKICRIDQLSKIKAGGDAPDDSTKEITDECSIPIYSNGIENEGLYGYTSKAKINKPSISISARGTVGYTCLRRVPYTPIVRLICIIPHEENLANWLFYYFKRTIVIANGTSQQQITIPMMSREKVLLPTNDLIQKFYEYSTCYLDEIDSLRAQNSNLEKQRDMLLPRLMSGKLEV